MFKNKKGDILDLPIFLILIFILGVGFFIISFIVPSITGGLETAGLNNTVEGASAIQDLDYFGSTIIQRGWFFLFIGLCISTLISSFFIRTHPIWIFIYIIVLGMTILLGVYIHNAYESIILSPAFASFYASQGYINVVFSKIIRILLGVGSLSIIIIFAKFNPFRGGVDNGI